MLFDSHAHINNESFDEEEREALIAKIEASKVDYVMDIGFNPESSELAVKHANRLSWCYAAVGCHPHDTKDMDEEKLDRLRELAQEEKVRAIGEIGLDYYWVKEPEERRFQAEVFRAQMQLAGRLGLPVIIHDREAHLDSLTIAEQYPGVRGVFHCYSGSVDFAMRLLELGYLLSFTGVLTYKNAKKAAEVVRAAPLDRLMIETDAPYMAPEPFRGKRNSSLYVYRMAEAIAQIKDVPLEQVIEQTTENGKRLFGIA